MSRLPVTGQNAGIAAILVPGTTYYLSLNTADPLLTGANEMAGVTRQAFVASAAGTPSAGSISNTAALAVPNPGTVQATHISAWTTATGGQYVIGAILGTDASPSPVTAASITFAANAAVFSLK